MPIGIPIGVGRKPASFVFVPYHGKRVPSVSLRFALEKLILWLKSLKKELCIATHNLAFDGPRLFRAMQKHSLTAEFTEIISSFADTQLYENSPDERTKDRVPKLVLQICSQYQVLECTMLSMIAKYC